MNEYGVWIKNGSDETLVHTNTMMGCHRYTEIETAKNNALLNRWRIAPLPEFRVSVKTNEGAIIVAAFDDETTANRYARDYLENIGSKSGEDVVVVF
ncbi:hypothetical protein [Agrobacterium tumefaciens]|uniref:hypothetical protein n=1 Tax=Agrobacterium tumefaciens TaxID=358 RepID=UPI001573D1B4|nr:hypothetical protein [Agrobacterium tumefaciens]WCJ63824.1 hypothetical protein G6M15_06415 [Agrobacterium tumefaciens]